MKNLRNRLAAVILLGMMLVGTASANGGIIIVDRGGLIMSDKSSCTVKTGDVIGGVLTSLVGIIIVDRGGLIMSDKSSTTCQQSRDGIIIVD